MSTTIFTTTTVIRLIPTPTPPLVSGYPCSIEGESDLYGLGIRLGLYVQWFSTVLAYLYEPKDAIQCMVLNYFFSIAVAISSMVNREELYQQELMVVAILLMLPPSVIVVTMIDNIASHFASDKSDVLPAGAQPASPPPPRKPKEYDFAKQLRDLAGVIATTFLLSVAVWELFEGVNLATPVETSPECEPKFIRSRYLAGKYNTLVKVFAIICVICAPISLLALMAWKTRESKQAKSTGTLIRTHSFDSVSMPSRCPPEDSGHFNRRSLVAFIWGTVAAFVIAKIETIIKQNNIRGMLEAKETGQLIPLVVAGLNFCMVTYDYWVDPRRRQKRKNPPPTGPSGQPGPSHSPPPTSFQGQYGPPQNSPPISPSGQTGPPQNPPNTGGYIQPGPSQNPLHTGGYGQPATSQNPLFPSYGPSSRSKDFYG